MTATELKSARQIAAKALNLFEKSRRGKNVGPILNTLLHKTQQKRHATDLCLGTIRNLSLIDSLISKLTDCPIERIPGKIRNIIRIGVYELLFCPQTADYAIVNEAVENAKSISGKKPTGFVNALLRKIVRCIEERSVPLADTDSSRQVPQTSETACLFNSEILPAQENNPAEYFSTAFSLPHWLLTGWLESFGLETTREICFASNRRPGLYLRPNILKTSPEELTVGFNSAGIESQLVANSMIKIKAPASIPELPGFNEGLFTVQDLAAAEPVISLNPRPDWTILDLCAAPGTKTTQLAELTADRAVVYATDIDSVRLQMVRENILRLKLTSIETFEYNRLDVIAKKSGPFDAILLDVPCSNTAVLAKRPEVRYRLTPEAIKKLCKTQLSLLEYAAKLLKPDGKICYSTCSLQPDENTLLIERFLQQNPNLSLDSEKLTFPSAAYPDHDGGYSAIITSK